MIIQTASSDSRGQADLWCTRCNLKFFRTVSFPGTVSCPHCGDTGDTTEISSMFKLTNKLKITPEEE